MNSLSKIFTPFAKVDKTTTMCISIVWIALMFLCWYNAPTLIPRPGAIFHQLVEFLNPGIPTFNFNSSFPYFHVSFPKADFYFDIFASLELTFESMLLSIIIACIAAWLSTTPAFNFPVKVIMMFRFMSLIGVLFLFMTILNGNASYLKNSLLIFSIVPYFTLSLYSVIHKIQPYEYDLWTTLKYNKWEQLYQIIIIGKAEAIIEAIIANFSMGWVMMTVAETKSMADGGLGVKLFEADKYNSLDKVFALQIIIYSLGFICMVALMTWRWKQFKYTALIEK